MNVDLASIDIQSGVNDKGEGFCTVVCTSVAKDIVLGQLTPDEVRGMALDWLGAAEAAETDAIVFQMFSELDMPLPAVGKFIEGMRSRRT